jgi:hypothetical protein
VDDSELNPYVPYDKFQEANPYQSPTADPERVGHDMLTRVDEPLNPWFSIWTKPRATTRQILDTDPNRMIWVLASLSGIGQAFQNASNSGIIDMMPLVAVLAICIVLGPIGGIVGLAISAWLWRHSGRWLGGVGEADDVRAAVAWSYVPGIWAMLLWIPLLALFGGDVFSEGFWPAGGMAVVYGVLVAVGVVIMVWQFVVILKCVGEAHQFSAWRAWGAMILAGLAVAGVILAIVFGIMAVVVIVSAIA